MTTHPTIIYDHHATRLRHARLARDFAQHNFLHRATAEALLERYEDIRLPLQRVLLVGYHDDGLITALHNKNCVVTLVDDIAAHPALFPALPPHQHVVVDAETLPFAPASFDCILSNLRWQQVNDLPGILAQARRLLASGGAMLAAVLGGATLYQLRDAFYQAEQALWGGISPRLAPAIAPESMAGLLQRAGFALPVTDHDQFDVTYPHALALLRDLRGMRLGAALTHRTRRYSSRALFAHMAHHYASHYPAPSGEGITARFEILYLHGWQS
jgi:NADH dehydrogenase [ubiquinone] 1 alpha subcomplex assembly factor 5